MKSVLCLALLGLVPFIAALPGAAAAAPAVEVRSEKRSALDSILDKRVVEAIAKREEEDPEYDYIIIMKNKAKA
ncbi:hypothetical protein MMC20_002298 [Loxospora ochrophaea]|nr:hypothetical protein [Loxospora ochrophaea]